MNPPPAVSVVIATYNYGRFLAGAIDSVFAQTFPDYEVIVVDDGSDDDTGDVIGRYLRDPRVRAVRTDHLGQPAAKNAGFRLARGPLIAVLDADDLWLPAKLERQVALFRSDPELGLAYTRRLLIDETGRELPYTQPRLYRGDVLEVMFLDNFVCHSSVVIRREALDRVGLYDESIPMAIDYDLWLRVALHYRFDYVDEPMVWYRTGHANLSRRAEERSDIAMGIMRRFLDEIGGRERLGARTIRRAWSETYSHRAQYARQRSRKVALGWYLRAVAADPRYLEPWRDLITLPLPRSALRWLRAATGRRATSPASSPVACQAAPGR
jgi:glycosyltransferase involved in cell wall biosynthesis